MNVMEMKNTRSNVMNTAAAVSGTAVLTGQCCICRAAAACLQVWSSSYAHLLPKVQLIAGDMFDAATIPAPPPDCDSTAYVLRNILHDW
jgi:hypothetical protein